MKTALTIAGSDSCGGAGIQADIKTMTCNGIYAMSVITALTAQNTTEVSGISEVTPEFLEQQITAVVTDIKPDAVKTGMIPSSQQIEVIARCIKKYDLKNIVVDPVMVATSGSKLISEEAVETLKRQLFSLAAVVTPNIPEAEILSGMKIESEMDMQVAAEKICFESGCTVLVKGGHSISDANDFLYDGKNGRWFMGKRIENPNTHGTGCTLSSAIAANLAKGDSIVEATCKAKEYLSNALGAMLNLGKGSGPLMHNWNVEYKRKAD